MARRSNSARRRPRRGKRSVALRVAGVLVLALIAVAAWLWWEARHWRPEEAIYPDHGAVIGTADAPVDFSVLHGLGAQFVYLRASAGAKGRDGRFTDDLADARATGLLVGAVHEFDPCIPADAQSANFVTVIPRDKDLLPPAIALDRLASDCPSRVSDAAVQSELMTLVNQIEAHVGKPVILAPSAAFEREYGIARRIDRNLWLTRDWFEPTYGDRPWLLWTANTHYQTEAAPKPISWVVVQP